MSKRPAEPAESKYIRLCKASVSERIDLIRQGVPAQMLVDTCADMGITKERILALLQFPRSTANRRISDKESLTLEFSERLIGLQKLNGQVESILADADVQEEFNTAHWFAQWLERPLPALANAKPADFMDTMEGQRLVAGLLSRIQSGAYA